MAFIEHKSYSLFPPVNRLIAIFSLFWFICKSASFLATEVSSLVPESRSDKLWRILSLLLGTQHLLPKIYDMLSWGQHSSIPWPSWNTFLSPTLFWWHSHCESSSLTSIFLYTPSVYSFTIRSHHSKITALPIKLHNYIERNFSCHLPANLQIKKASLEAIPWIQCRTNDLIMFKSLISVISFASLKEVSRSPS